VSQIITKIPNDRKGFSKYQECLPVLAFPTTPLRSQTEYGAHLLMPPITIVFHDLPLVFSFMLLFSISSLLGLKVREYAMLKFEMVKCESRGCWQAPV
jgi:hypothetical protein